MKIPSVTIQQLLEAGVHLGHKTLRWNPKMKKYIFGKRDSIHIIDLTQTLELINVALEKVYKIISENGKILFISTKKQASEAVAELAKETGQYYVNHRWLGGMLTNWATVSQSIKRLRDLEGRLSSDEVNQLGKKEILQLTRERDKLELTLGGIKEMGGLPDMLFILDTNKEDIAVLEANKLNIPIVAIIDSNANPTGVDFPIPGNDDAMRAITLYCELAQTAVLDGLQAELMASGTDIGSAEAAPEEPTLTEAPIEATDAEPADEAPTEDVKDDAGEETSTEQASS